MIIDSVKNSTVENKIAQAVNLAEPLGKCPLCTSEVNASHKAYNCSSENCNFVIWKSVAKKDLSPKIIRQLLSQGKTDTVKGFTGKSGKFDAGLKLVEGKVEFSFAPREEVEVGTCPKCKTHKIKALQKLASCECGFKIWREIAKKALSDSQLKTLIGRGETTLIKGFKSKAGKTFSAKIKFDKDFKTTFVFEKK